MLYFIAIVAPHQVNQRVLEWKQYMQEHFNCQVALKSPAHITLVAPFTMEAAHEFQLIDTLDTLARDFNSFPIQLKNFDAFKPRVLFVHVEPDEQLTHLKQTVEDAFILLIKKETRPFHPHITIANRDLKQEDFPIAWAHFQSINYEAIMDADNISLLRHDGTVWQILHQAVLQLIR